jgi:signal transduction histidine kinase
VSLRKVAHVGVRGPRVQDLGGETIRLPAPSRGTVAAPAPVASRTDLPGRRRQQLNHDIRHELGTVMMLASLLASGDDVGPDGRRTASQLIEETRWLLELQNAYQNSAGDDRVPVTPSLELVRLDQCARQTVTALGLLSGTAVEIRTAEVWAAADRLALWRALRNIVGNAIRAAGPTGHVALTVERSGSWATVQVDDDGPGFGAAAPGAASMGLDIVYESVAACGGRLEIFRSTRGGCGVRVGMPAVTVRDRNAAESGSGADDFRGFDALADL